MYRISHVHEISQIEGIPKEIIDIVKSTISILDRVYGDKRDPLSDDGGYVILLTPSDNINIFIDLDLNILTLRPEYTDIIKTSQGIEYIHALILFNNEFSVHILMPEDKAPKNLLL